MKVCDALIGVDRHVNQMKGAFQQFEFFFLIGFILFLKLNILFKYQTQLEIN